MAKKLKGTTSSGFEFKIKEEALDDIEFLEMLTESDDDDPLALIKLIQKLLGEKQKARLYEHLRGEDGRVPATAVVAEVDDMFKQIKELKN